MPPPMPNPSKRITANPVRPARYRPGKAVPEEESSDEDEEDEAEQSKQPVAASRPRAQPQRSRVPITHDEDDDDDEEGFVTDEEEGAPATVPVKAPAKSTSSTTARPSAETRTVPSQPVQLPIVEKDEESSEEESEESDGSSEEESSSEDEAPQRKFQRPTFIRKADRQKSAEAAVADTSKDSTITAATSTADVDEQTRRLAQADLYIKDKLERDAIARSQGRRAWDDDEELAPEDAVDDTDGLDPAAEHAGWRLRELKRLKRDREAIEAREKEIEELERRRNLTQDEREAEDRAFLDSQKAERDESRGKTAFLSKYHHKGAFFQNDETAELLRRRDVMGARFQDEVADKSALPEYMRVRDMTKLGKKGRTRYTDLRGEDTGRFGEAVKRWRGSGYDNNNNNSTDQGRRDGMDPRDVDERFLPDAPDRRDPAGGRSQGPTGANASAVGRRRDRDRSRSRSRSPPSQQRRTQFDLDRDRGDSYRPPRRRSYSRSRSPERDRRTRRRGSSSSGSLLQSDRDKRRRLEV